MNTANRIYQEIDITDKLTTYFDNTDEIDDFCNIIKDKFKELESKNYTNICFSIDYESYSEYDDNYTDIKYLFTYERELTKLELLKEEKEKAKKFEDEKIFSELCGKLSTNSIGSIIQNEDLRKLYLDGNIKI